MSPSWIKSLFGGKPATPLPPKPIPTTSIEANFSAARIGYQLSPEDEKFEIVFEQEFVAKGMVDDKHHFHSAIAGMSHPNTDGSSRQEIASRCKRFDVLHLLPEPNNPYDKNAILVRTQSGETVGHLKSAHAKEISSHLKYGKQMWVAVVKSVGSESPGEPVGMRIVLCRLTDEWVKKSLAKGRS